MEKLIGRIGVTIEVFKKDLSDLMWWVFLSNYLEQNLDRTDHILTATSNYSKVFKKNLSILLKF